jgi:hypothetical protein
MSIDSIIAVKRIDTIIEKYRDSIAWLKDKYPSRRDLIDSMEQSIISFNIVRKDIIVIDCNLEIAVWM